MRSIVQRGVQALSRPAALLARHCWGAITGVETAAPVAALTFDDGPNPRATPALLAILEKHDARATFFMVGEVAQGQPELVRQIAQAGHAIGNHSWSHLSLPLLTRRECREQVRRCHEALQPYGQKLFRPPYCHLSSQNSLSLLRAGYPVIAFNVHVEDWLNREASWMAEQLVRRIRPGSIVILHDNIYRSVLPAALHDRQPMLAALGAALAELHGRFEFVTIPELLRRGKPIRQHWRRTDDAELLPALQRDLQNQRRQAVHQR